MKLSNFEWTDKDSVKWFIMLPSGHEGPYSLKSIKDRLDKKSLSGEAKIWAEGLSESIPAKNAINKFEAAKTEEINLTKLKVAANPPVLKPIIQKPVTKLEPVPEPEILPPLPIPDPVVEIEDEIPPLPPLPEEQDEEAEPPVRKSKKSSFPVGLVATVALIFMAYIFYAQWIQGQEHFSIRRYARMSPELHEKIMKDLTFDGWDKKIFFKEYVPADLSYVWLINSGYQTCDVDASFRSIKGKLLSMKDGEVAFKSKSILKNHVAEFSTFEFLAGQKIIPGLYEVDIAASSCQWDGIVPKIANKFRSPDAFYVARTKVILFPQGASEFNALLDRLLQKKNDLQIKIENKDDLFWQDMDEKLQTLNAITLQIEQLFLDLLDKDARKFSATLKLGINDYTRQFGSSLTNFVISNEKDFQKIPDEDKIRLSQTEDYEKVIRLTSKDIGLESMKIIERLQAMKNPKRIQLDNEKKKISQAFKSIENRISQKLSHIQAMKAP